MKIAVTTTSVPDKSEITRHISGAYFYDCHETSVESTSKSALEIYLEVVSKTPGWVNALMAIRNRVVTFAGLKNLGSLSNIKPAKPASSYKVGDRIGIFSLLFLSDNEIILGDSDKHLDVKVSVCKITAGSSNSVAISTAVHLHNTLGRVYLFPVVPMHKIIVPAMLRRLTKDKLIT